MTIRLIAIDLDKSLIGEDLRIGDRNKRAIARAVEKGVHITIATGRMYISALPYARELGISMPLITYNGALIRSSTDDTVYYKCPMPLAEAQEVVRRARTEHLHVNYYVDDQLYMEEENEYARHYRDTYKVMPHIGPLHRLTDPPLKIIVTGDPDKLNAFWDQAAAHFGDRLHIAKSNPEFLEFTHPQATKGMALAVLADKLGIKREEVMAIGDSYNDIPMLEFAGVGVAMGNADEKVKAAADFVTAHHQEDGVAVALEKFVLEDNP